MFVYESRRCAQNAHSHTPKLNEWRRRNSDESIGMFDCLALQYNKKKLCTHIARISSFHFFLRLNLVCPFSASATWWKHGKMKKIVYHTIDAKAVGNQSIAIIFHRLIHVPRCSHVRTQFNLEIESKKQKT